MSVKHAVLSGILLASSLATACGPSYVVYRVPAPPPPAVVGAVGFAPGPGFVWVDGFWDLRGNRWGWVGGRWERPPRQHAIWDRDRWERNGDHWRFHRGRWR